MTLDISGWLFRTSLISAQPFRGSCWLPVCLAAGSGCHLATVPECQWLALAGWEAASSQQWWLKSEARLTACRCAQAVSQCQSFTYFEYY